jgi:N-dimethylarginine dimethylaminohydrolase
MQVSDGLNEVGVLTRVLVKHARDAFIDQATIDAQWSRLDFSDAPDFSRAVAQYDGFLEILSKAAVDVWSLPPARHLSLDSLYTRDASVLAAPGSIACSMGKEARTGEPEAQADELERRGQRVVGRISKPGALEGGDVIWLDDRTIVVGQGRRTNAEGIRQLRNLLGPSKDVMVVPLPEVRSTHDVLHLMSFISPIDRDLAVVYLPLLPERFHRSLLERGYRLVAVPDEEFESMGTNVLALAPRVSVMVRGNPRTRAALERAGAQVHEFDGDEICLKGGGGPTCLTRPLARSR